MKKIFIVPIIVILFFVLLFAIAETSQSGSKVKTVSYDCAKEFDKFVNHYSKNEYWLGFVADGLMFSGDPTSYKNEFDFLDNRCYTTYKTWMTDSDFQYFIEERKQLFEQFSHQEQLFNHEVDCTKNNDREIMWCNAKESVMIHFNAFEKHCSTINDNSSQSEIDKCWIGFMTEINS